MSAEFLSDQDGVVHTTVNHANIGDLFDSKAQYRYVGKVDHDSFMKAFAKNDQGLAYNAEFTPYVTRRAPNFVNPPSPNPYRFLFRNCQSFSKSILKNAQRIDRRQPW